MNLTLYLTGTCIIQNSPPLLDFKSGGFFYATSAWDLPPQIVFSNGVFRFRNHFKPLETPNKTIVEILFYNNLNYLVNVYELLLAFRVTVTTQTYQFMINFY